MRNDTLSKPASDRVTDAVEIDEFVTQKAYGHRDQYAHYSHELAEDTAEAASRVLARTVPVAYGILLGLTTNALWLWTVGGLLLAIAIDLGHRKHSLTRRFAKRLHSLLCPLLGAAAQTVAEQLLRRGFHMPAFLHRLDCGVGH